MKAAIRKARRQVGPEKPTAIPDTLFTLDDHITKPGLGKFLDALRYLGTNEAQVQAFADLRRAKLSVSQKEKIKNKIDRADREREELEKLASDIVANKETRDGTMHFY